jgi:hypothetical protein
MERLRRAGLRAILRCVREFSVLAGLHTFSHRKLAQLRRLVPADYVTYTLERRPLSGSCSREPPRPRTRGDPGRHPGPRRLAIVPTCGVPVLDVSVKNQRGMQICGWTTLMARQR